MVSLGNDKKNNMWHQEILKVLENKDINPRDFNTDKIKINLVCSKHGTSTKTIRNMYENINKHGKVLCNKCSREFSIKKSMKTNLERYGGQPAQNPTILNKMRNTNLEKYGVEYVVNSKGFQEKRRETNLNRYGYEHALSSPIIRSRRLETLKERYGTRYNKPTHEPIKIESSIKKDHINKEMIMNETLTFLKDNGIKYMRSYTGLGKEIDILIDKASIGIDIIDLYTNSNMLKKRRYHYRKYKYYEDIGIRIINIYEDEWSNEESQDILKSIILSACNKVDNRSIKYARKLKLVELDKKPETLKKISEFYNENHLQGFRPASVHLALMEDDEILEMMSFGHPFFGNRNNKNYQYELIRHCTKLYHSVVGGKERLFKYFINNYQYNDEYLYHIVSYCDMDKFNGNSYIQLGFKLHSHSLQVWGLEDNYTNRVSRNVSNNEYFKTLPKIYGSGNNTYVY